MRGSDTLEKFVALYARYGLARGHVRENPAATTSRARKEEAKHFASWLEERGITLDELTEPEYWAFFDRIGVTNAGDKGDLMERWAEYGGSITVAGEAFGIRYPLSQV